MYHVTWACNLGLFYYVLALSLTHGITTGYLTWEWTAKIRGYLYPAVFTVLYKAVELLRIDSYAALVGRQLQYSLFSILSALRG